MGSFSPYGRGGGRGRGRGYHPQNLQMWETHPGKPPVRTRINPDPISGYFKLFVSSIPRIWTEVTLENLFRKVGNPVSVYLNRGDGAYNWGFVEFETYREASYAITELNSNVLLDGVKVAFAKEKAYEEPVFDEEDDFTFNVLNQPVKSPIVSANSSSYSKSELDHKPARAQPPRMMSITCKNHQTLGASIPRHNVIPSPCLPEEIQGLENSIDERKLCIMKNPPPCHICDACGKDSNLSCGNCCVPVTTSNNSQLNEHSRYVNSRENGLTNGFRPHKSERNPRFQSDRSEERQGSRYEDRQPFDKKFNERHNDNSRQINRFGDRQVNQYDNGQNERENLRDHSRPINEKERPKTMFEERKSRLMSNKQTKLEPGSEDGQDSKINSGTEIVTPLNQKTEVAKPVETPTSPVLTVPTKPVVKTEIGETLPTAQVPISAIKTEPVEEVAPPQTCQTPIPSPRNDAEPTISCDLKPGIEEEVWITTVDSPGVFYVQKKELSRYFCQMNIEMNEPTTLYTPFSPVDQGLCASQFDNEWSRCQVTSVNPLIVFFIDFGNSETVTADQLFTLPEKHAAKPSFAIKIKLADGTPEDFLKKTVTDVLSIKAVNKVDGCWLVQVAGVTYPQPTIQSVRSPEPVPRTIQNSPQVASVPAFSKLLPAGVFTKVSVRHKEQVRLAVTPVTLLPELEQLSARIQAEVRTCDAITPAITKCLVRSRMHNLWCRGRIIKLDPLLVKLVDFGNTERCHADYLREIPPQLASLVPFVVYIKPNQGTVEELGHKSVFSVKPLYKDESGCWVVEVDSSESNVESKAENTSSRSELSITRSDVPNQRDLSTQAAPPQPELPTQAVVQPQSTSSGIIIKDQFTTVTITYKDPEHSKGVAYFVGKPKIWLSSLCEMTTFFRGLSKNVKVSPQIGDIGLALYLDDWYRVKVVSQSPLKVFFIDYGNTETLSAEELKICPDSHQHVPPLVQKMVLAPGTNEKYCKLPETSEISIKPISMGNDGSVIVQIEGETYSEPTSSHVMEHSQQTDLKTVTHDIPKTPVLTKEVQAEELPVATDLSSTVQSLPEPQYVADLLQKDYKMDFVPFIVDPAKNYVFGCLTSANHFPDCEIIFEDMDTVMETEPDDPNFTPREGELVVCKTGPDCERGLVLELEGKRWISLVDRGVLIPNCPCKKLPSKYTRAPFMAAILMLYPPVDVEFLKIIMAKTSIDVHVKELESVECVVQSRVGEREFTAKMKKWYYDPLMWPLPLYTGDVVTISKVLDSNTVLVVPADDDMQIHQNIQTECIKANCEAIQFHPVVGDHVVIQEKNPNVFCRARVIKINSDNNHCTLYKIDWGREFDASLSDLQPMPPTLCKVTSRASAVVLKDVQKVDMTDLARLYISNLVEEDKRLRVKIQQNIGLVTLSIEANGQVVNERLKELLTTPIVPDLNGKFTFNCLAPKNPPMNEELHLLVTLSDPLFMQNTDGLGQFDEEVHKPLQIYANSNSAPYNPCENEVCIAKFEGEWYRVLCLKETNTGVSHVILLDFGNVTEVPTSDIQKITKDFLSYPCIGLQCKIKGLPEEITPQLRSRLEHHLGVNSVHLGIFECEEDGIYCVRLPKVLTALNLENLVP